VSRMVDLLDCNVSATTVHAAADLA
jgi:hypothetical protein